MQTFVQINWNVSWKSIQSLALNWYLLRFNHSKDKCHGLGGSRPFLGRTKVTTRQWNQHKPQILPLNYYYLHDYLQTSDSINQVTIFCIKHNLHYSISRVLVRSPDPLSNYFTQLSKPWFVIMKPLKFNCDFTLKVLTGRVGKMMPTINTYNQYILNCQQSIHSKFN